MSATHQANCTASEHSRLYVAFELGWTSWKLAFATGLGRSPRIVTVSARDLNAVEREILKAKRRFGLPDNTPVLSCYEAGRDGFWLHRYLTQERVQNYVIDSSSIEVDRRARRAKSDRIDAGKLVTKLVQCQQGDENRFKIVHVPSPEVEDRRQRQRELIQLKNERTTHSNRIKGLLAAQGVEITVDTSFPKQLELLRKWDGTPIPPELQGRLLREFERWKLVDRQVRDLTNQQRREVRDDSQPDVEQVRSLLELKGIGPVSAWLLVREVFGWRPIANRRQLASLVGLVPSPYQSGTTHREQGISKAGNKRVRWVMIELAWMWLRYQGKSQLSQWYMIRFGSANARARKVGIVALARKLLIALWKYLDQGEIPLGAELKPWREKLSIRTIE